MVTALERMVIFFEEQMQPTKQFQLPSPSNSNSAKSESDNVCGVSHFTIQLGHLNHKKSKIDKPNSTVPLHHVL